MESRCARAPSSSRKCGAIRADGRPRSRGCSAPWMSSRWTSGAPRDAGVLLGRAGTSDPVDASLVLLAEGGDRILTSDPDDLRHLADASGLRVAVVEV